MIDKKERKDYWDQRWKIQETGWDIGYPSTPVAAYIDQLEDKSLHILIPGCGSAYEGWYAWHKGFENITLMDLSELPLKKFQTKHPEFPAKNLICQDFFEHQGTYDLILEQTFFCAIPVALRDEYVRKMNTLLSTGGKLAGVLFDCIFEKEGPPFGGSKKEYEERFKPYFNIIRMEPCTNSIAPRMDRELFFELEKK